MRPFLAPGDGVAVDWGRDAGWVPGDVVLAREAGGTWIVHRVVARRGDGYVAKGDSALALDRFAPGEIWGRVVGVRRAGDGAEAPLARSRMDGWIAALSLASVSGLGRVAAAVARRCAWALGVRRRGALWKTARKL